MTSPRLAAMRRFIEREQSGWPLSGVLAWPVAEGRQIEDTGGYVTESLTANPRVGEQPGPYADIGVVTGKAPTYLVKSSLASLSS